MKLINHICNHVNSDELFSDYEKEISYFSAEKSCVDLNRIYSDKGCNNYGYKFCKCNNLYILNGRAARDKGKGLLTCKNSTMVDYFVCSSNLIPKVSDFCVEDFCEILSDVHCPVFLELIFEKKSCTETTESSSNEVKIKLWDQKKHELSTSMH